MKKCPQCGSAYSDETLSFCLSDGTPLDTVAEAETEVISAEAVEELRIPIETDADETVTYGTPAITTSSEEPRRGKAGLFIGGFVAALVLFGIVGMGALGVYYYSTNSSQPKVVDNKNTDPDLANLQKKVDELKGRLNENTAVTISATPTPLSNTQKKDFVNCPSDGFLALRSIPNHKTGKRIAKIPHGVSIAIQNCQSKRVKIGKKTGRWCKVTYKGNTGWVFDAWLKR